MRKASMFLPEATVQRLISQIYRALPQGLARHILSRGAKNVDDSQDHSMAAALLPLGCERLTPGWTRIFPPSVVVAMIPSL
jgi:hypothetical protein